MRSSNRILRLDHLLWALRALALLHVLAVFTQAVYAGQFLSGIESPVRFHEVSGWGIVAVAIAQLISAILWHRRTERGLWLTLSTICVLLAEMLQIGTGYGRFPGVHIPLGVLIFGAVGWQLMRLFGESGRRAI